MTQSQTDGMLVISLILLPPPGCKWPLSYFLPSSDTRRLDTDK